MNATTRATLALWTVRFTVPVERNDAQMEADLTAMERLDIGERIQGAVENLLADRKLGHVKVEVRE